MYSIGVIIRLGRLPNVPICQFNTIQIWRRHCYSAQIKNVFSPTILFLNPFEQVLLYVVYIEHFHKYIIMKSIIIKVKVLWHFLIFHISEHGSEQSNSFINTCSDFAIVNSENNISRSSIILVKTVSQDLTQV